MSPNLMFMVPLAQAAAEGGVQVLMDGEGGDELFGFSPYVFADLLLHGRLARALALADSLPGMSEASRGRALRRVFAEWAMKGALPYRAHELVRLLRKEHHGLPWLTTAAARRQRQNVDRWEWKRLDGPRWWASLAFQLTEGRQRLCAHDFLRHKSALAGVQGRHPYFEDLDLLQCMLRIPTEMSLNQRLDRPLLRRAADGRLPDQARLRSEKSSFNSLFHQVLASTDRDALLRLLAHRPRVAEHVDVETVRGYLLDPSSRPSVWAWVVWRVVAAECWLRSLEEPAFPARCLLEWQLEPPRLKLKRGGGLPSGRAHAATA
jgi:asparagine synthetase B (glutamine-hydrolysing)